ncbi:serine/threonine-protein kinase PknK [Nocardia nova SH22a]|uniref:Serine/threonine-protein kinase PknK n=1 Tax=Nocardia nova SH22a TaxID=1415166 RepID=W5TED6_9NOCA|nr:protein kinase [Nocardia nova]AHH17592.1 serine/threonine-protein kinase PknK [Nocardia nova SH22a]
MTDDEAQDTRREVATPLVAELADAGFADAVEIGRGGFGVVYRCEQAALDRTVAVKVLTTELDADNQARFLREQQAMGRLTGHPNIVTVLAAGSTAGGHPFLVMPFHPADSLDRWIREHGPIAVRDALSIGVKIAGALESAHRLDIVHRDVKPGNILLTEYGEPALTDFGIAHVAGGFRTAAGTLTGSPAFTAPEVLEGGTPNVASDVYGLGATLFSALTGHAAFERRSGENVVTQFRRITTQPVPDLQDDGLPSEVAALVASAMNRDPGSRPSAAAFGEAIRRVQQRLGYPVDNMALRGGPGLNAEETGAAGTSARRGNLPAELTGFINRRAELAEVRNLLSASRLVTLTGVGGVGKTRLALRVAATRESSFAGGAWLAELSDVSDPTLLVDVVAAALGARDEPDAALLDVLIRRLGSRETLLILDNCEQLVEAAAKLADVLLRSCPDLRILATSREPLNIAGESVVLVPPLTAPAGDEKPALRRMARFDAVALFCERAAAAVPGFRLDEQNRSSVAQICARLDGLPLAIELAAARLRSLSPQQIVQHLDDRFALLTQGSRAASTRQQTLRWCIDWSYDICTPAEQRLWARLAVFAGTFELDAAEEVSGWDLTPYSTLDVVTALVDKSILVREEVDGLVRFRMLETLRDYGRFKLRESGEYRQLRRRHCDWYQRLAVDAEAGWLSHRQPEWIARIGREQANLREALDASLSDETAEAAGTALRTTAALYEFWFFRGQYGEGRSWLDRALACSDGGPILDRVKALRADTQLAAVHGDLRAAESSLRKARAFLEQSPLPLIRAQIDHADGIVALARGDIARACTSLHSAVDTLRAQEMSVVYVNALAYLCWAYEARGDMARMDANCHELLSMTESSGELSYRCGALRGIGVAAWQRGDNRRAQELIRSALRLNRRLNSPIVAAFMLESLAWVVADADAERAAVLLGAVDNLWPAGSGGTTIFPAISPFHGECERSARRVLGGRRFDLAFRRGHEQDIDDAVAYALGEQPVASSARSPAILTDRERQVADLVARGLTNKRIAAELVISARTVDGHVEHILTKLGFSSRAQIAAWAAENDPDR